MTEITRYGDRPRLSRAKLHDWLEKEGPQTLRGIFLWAQLQTPGITLETVESILEDHPRLFAALSRDKWSAVERDRGTIVIRRPLSPKRAGSPKKRASEAHSHPSPREEPGADEWRAPDPPPAAVTPEQPVVVSAGRVNQLLLPGSTDPIHAVYESGKYVLVSFAHATGESALTAGEPQHRAESLWRSISGETVQLYERGDDDIVFRGTRQLLAVHVSVSNSRTYLVFGAASDDHGRYTQQRVTRGGSALLLPAGAPARALLAAPAKLVAQHATVSPALRPLLSLPPATRPVSDSELLSEARRRFARAEGDDDAWRGCADWIVRQKPRITQRQMETILRMALNWHGLPTLQVVTLARQVLPADSSPTDSDFARDCSVALGAAFAQVDYTWANELLQVARASHADDPALALATARIRYQQNRPELAASCYIEAFERDAPDITSIDWDQLLLLAGTGDAALAERTIAIAEKALAEYESPADLVRRLPIVKDIPAVYEQAGRPIYKAVERLLQVLVAAGDDRQVIQTCRIYNATQRLSVTDKLQLLSVAESCDDLCELLDVYADLLGAVITDARLDVIAQALIQLRFVEKLDGSFGHDLSDYYEAEAKRRWVKIPDAVLSLESSPLRLDGIVITIVGGDARGRGRLVATLVDSGAIVRQIPPSFEERLGERVVMQRVIGADIVALWSDCVKHDVQQILRNSNVSLTFTSGGPSRVLRAITEQAGRISRGAA